MKTNWEYSLDLEALRVIEIAYGMENGFFRSKNFPILPHGTDYHDKKIIIFPALPYGQVNRFWQRVRSIDFDRTPVTADQSLVKEVKRLLQKNNLKPPRFEATKSVWEKNQTTILKSTEKIIPNIRKMIRNLIIYPTVFGSNVSFFIPKKFPSDIRIYLREDADVYGLMEGLLSAVTRHKLMTQLDASWEESELLVDWLINYSTLNQELRRCQLRTNFSPTMKVTRFQQRGQLLKASEAFYRKLGLKTDQPLFSIDKDRVLYDGRPITNLTAREQKILMRLIVLRGRILTYDEFASLVFTSEDDFSLFVLAKIIQSLREKLEKNQIPSRLLQSIRKSGYCLLTIQGNNAAIG